ncbi:ABC transporter permease [Alkalinema pantanalense CENA528]|uniref:ABC transporter permease n=1 Tax=Alkalinema pantanalense TaxID=1620705 RepID=UPI003D6E8789
MARSNSLKFYIATRLLMAPLMLWLITTLVFLLLRATPGDPADALLGPKASPAAKAALRAQCGLDKSLIGQYGDYLGSLLRLDLGKSCSGKGTVVWDVIQQHFPATAELAIGSLAIALMVGVAIGALSASKPNSGWDTSGRLFGIITYAIPLFWFGMLLQLIFSVGLGLFPLGTRFPTTMPTPTGITGLYTIDSLLSGNFQQFFTALYYLALPALSLGILISGIFERIVRVNLKQTLQADYVEAARARGIPERRILWNHAFRNTLIPVVTILGLTLAAMLGGAILTEVTFSWPGLANRLYRAIAQRDYAVVQGIVVFFAAIVAIASIAIDIINAYIDPRIRY